MYCPSSPNCDHHCLVNRKRYRNTTETSNKQKAKQIESKERSRILDGRHGIREQPDITFKAFAEVYLCDHARLHKRSVQRDEEIITVLNRSFRSLTLHEITAHRIEQFKRDRLAGKWRGHKTTSAAKPIKPATVNRELDTLRSILSKAIEWGELIDHPMRMVKRLKVENRRTRILTDDEQRRLLEACPRKLRAIATLALITGARLASCWICAWESCQDSYVTFLETKNGRARRISPSRPQLPLCWPHRPAYTHGYSRTRKRKNRSPRIPAMTTTR